MRHGEINRITALTMDYNVQGMLPYPTNEAAAHLAAVFSVKEKHARKSVVDARVAGLIPGYPAGAFIYVMFHKPRGALCTRAETFRSDGTRNTIYHVLPSGEQFREPDTN